LAKITKDILAIPVSTVASESAFSTSGRVLHKFRSTLNPATVETLVCGQDWIRRQIPDNEVVNLNSILTNSMEITSNANVVDGNDNFMNFHTISISLLLT